MIHLKAYRDAAALTEAATNLLREYIAPQPSHTGPSAIMLAGGSTPMAAYAQIAAQPPPVAPGLRMLFSDDRHVPPDSPKSNFGNTKAMLAALGLGPDRVLRVAGELPLAEAVAHYDAGLRQLATEGVPVRLGLLGLGADGHTASLFTPAHIAQAKGRYAIGVDRPDGMQGVSVTPEFLARVERIVFLIAGEDKRPMVAKLLREPQSLTAGLAMGQHRHVEVWTAGRFV